MNKERLLWPDVARGVLILIVVIGHTLQHGDYEHNVLWNVIYSFHMAAFFAISGYVSYKPKAKWSILGRRAKQLLVPFCLWSLIESICIGNTGAKLFEFLVYPDSGFWFVYALFFIVALMVCFNKLSAYLNVNDLYIIGGGNLLIIGLMVLMEWRMFGFQFIAFYFFFYALGFFIRKYEIRISMTISMVLGLLWLLTAIFWHGHEIPAPLSSFQMIPASILIYSSRFLSATLGSLFVLGISPYIFRKSQSLVCRLFSYLGNVSLGIYIIHAFVALMIDHYGLLLPYFRSTTSYGFLVSFFMICLSLSLFLIWAMSKNKITSLLLLGK